MYKNWRETFTRARCKDIKAGNLKVPSIVNDESIKLVTEAVAELKEKLHSWYDPYTDYIESWKQEQDAKNSNIEICDCQKILDDKLKLYISLKP